MIDSKRDLLEIVSEWFSELLDENEDTPKDSLTNNIKYD